MWLKLKLYKHVYTFFRFSELKYKLLHMVFSWQSLVSFLVSTKIIVNIVINTIM